MTLTSYNVDIRVKRVQGPELGHKGQLIMVQTPTSSFPVRDVTFELPEGIPRRWHSDRAAVTVFFNNLSTLFPEGERFFIRSVARYRRRIDDPQLLAEVRAFSSQEGVHTREHELYNAMLRSHGYDVDGLERSIRRLLRLPRLTGRYASRVSLAVTVALEHWTAMLGHFVLEDDSIMDGAHPQMAALWRWHAAEECEHKAVAFDVYEAIGGGYALRASVMLLASLIFWLRVGRQQWLLMREDGLALDFREWIDLGRFLLVEQRALGRLLPIWASFFRPSFHPWQLDDAHLLDRWRTGPANALIYKRRVPA